MTISTRNNLLLGILVLCGIIMVSALLGAAVLWEEARDAAMPAIPVVSLFTAGFALGGGFLFRIFFRRSISVEVFFFTLFVLAFFFETFRLGVLYIVIREEPFYLGVLFTRIIHFGRFFRLFSLFTAGLFAVSTKGWKPWLFLGVIALVSFTLVAGIPINPTRILPQMMYEVGNRTYMLVIALFFSFFTILNLVLAAVLKSTREYYYIAASVALVLVGNILIMYFISPLLLSLGGFLLVGGSFFFGKLIHGLYLWS
jgi:hypothetical protein